MRLSELIAHVGDENIKVQRIDQSLVASKTNKKGVTEITFATDQIHTNDLIHGSPAMHGIVIWIPRDRLKEALPTKKIP